MFFFFFKQKTAYEIRISDWSSDVCSSDLRQADAAEAGLIADEGVGQIIALEIVARIAPRPAEAARQIELRLHARRHGAVRIGGGEVEPVGRDVRAVEIGRAAGRARVCPYG